MIGSYGVPRSIVEIYLATFHVDTAIRFDVDLAASRDRDVLALNGDRAILFHRDARAAGLDRHGVARVDDEVLTRFD